MDDAFDRLATKLMENVNSSRVANLVAKLQKVLSNKEASEMIVSTGILIAIISTEAPIEEGKTVLSAIFAVATKLYDEQMAGKTPHWGRRAPQKRN